MRRRKGKITIMLAMAIGVFSSFFAFLPRNKAVSIEKMAHWEYAPTIRVCKVSPLSVNEVAAAVQWWKDLGYDFDLIYSSDCIKTNKFATITITLDQGELFMNNLLVAQPCTPIQKQKKYIGRTLNFVTRIPQGYWNTK